MIPTFKEWILMTEAPAAYKGKYEGGRVKLGAVSTRGINAEWVELSIMKDNRLGKTSADVRVFIKKEKHNRVIIGVFDDTSDSFIIRSELYAKTYYNLDKHNYRNVLQTSEVKTDSDFMYSGYGTSLYLTLLNNGYTLISDYSQYDGARNLWRGLQKHNIKIDLYDEAEDSVTKEHKIIHTDLDSFLDKEWSIFPDTSKQDILFIAFKG